jgi:hypothetical protein
MVIYTDQLIKEGPEAIQQDLEKSFQNLNIAH